MSNTITDKLNLLLNTKQEIKSALIEKGQNVTDVFSTYPEKIRAIEAGGIDTSDATATENDILNGKTAYVNDEKITGNINTVSQATPVITIDANGLINATSSQSEGFVQAGTTTGTKQLSTQAAKTITPSTSNKTAVAANKYTLGAVTVAGDANLTAANIKNGVNIFGVTGTYTSDATAEAADIRTGKTAYVNGAKITGTYSPPTLASMTGDATATENSILYGKSAYVDGELIEGALFKTTTLTVVANGAGFYHGAIYFSGDTLMCSAGDIERDVSVEIPVAIGSCVTFDFRYGAENNTYNNCEQKSYKYFASNDVSYGILITGENPTVYFGSYGVIG